MRSSNSLLLAVLLASVPVSAKVLEDVVARVNGKPLLLTEYKKNVRSVMENYQRSMPQLLRDDEAVKELRGKVLEQMVDDELLAQEGDKLGVKIFQRELEKGVEEIQERNFRTDEETGKKRSDSEMRAALAAELEKEGLNQDQFQERIKRQLLMRKVIEEKVRPLVKEPDEKTLQAAFEKLKAVASSTQAVKGMPEETAQAYLSFGMRLHDSVSERVRVSHLLVKFSPGASMVERNQALKRAESLRRKIVEGADFAELAAKESDDAESAPRGGDLGFILKNWMPPEFEKSAFSLQVGDVSEPVESKFGYHLIRVQEKKAKDSLSFERVKGDVGQFLYTLSSQTELQSYIKKLRAAATVELTPPAE
ncbi:MAG: peptidylprolyl isomerase [Elusimicrobiota bacterium]|jgi:peptidyl-prolyl cis-trans isomerase C